MASETDKRWKGRKIDWLQIADMDSEEEELKPLNQQQVAVLLMLLDYQKWETRWENLELTKGELESFIGQIEYRLMLNESRIIVAAKDDIRDGIYEAANRIALQIATGVYANIGLSTDADGIVTQTTDDDGTLPLPADDPATLNNEAQSAIYGGVTSMCRAIELLLDKLDAYYGAVNGTPVTPQSDVQGYIETYFACDNTAMNTAIANYYAYRATNGKLVFDVLETMFQYVYCHGHNEQAFKQWLIDSSGYSVNKFNVVNGIISALADSFWLDYYNTGLSKPNTLYLDAACVPSPTEIMNMPLLGSTYTTQTTWKANHRLLITVENYFTDSLDSDIRDFWWYKTVAGTPSFQGAAANIQLGTGIIKPTTNQVPYRTDHKYTFTMDTPASGGVMQITIPATSITTPVASAVGVGFKVTIVDEGLYAV